MESESLSTSENSEDSFEINLTYKGRSNFIQVSTTTTALSLHKKTLQQVFGCFTDNNNDDESESEIEIKLLYKGKRISPDPDKYPFADHLLSSTNNNTNSSSSKKKKKNIPKIMIVATNNSIVQELLTKRSDPTIRGFDQEKEAIEKRKLEASQKKPWGEGMTQQHKEYKFCRMKACTWQSFGHRSTEETPHAFHAMQLLEKLATDPGIVAIMKERELVVGTLGELDPIDDRIMKKKENSGGCVLGYNTNHGLRIDIKLRSNDLSGFRSYPELASTLIHELSHNWVGEHNLLFWSNFAQMRAEYLYTYSQLRNSSIIVHGKKTAELAGLDKEKLENVFDFIMSELVQEMAQHGLHPNMIEGPIRQRIQELEENSKNSSNGHRLGEDTYTTDTTASSTRELILAAAERRAREQQKKEGDER